MKTLHIALHIIVLTAAILIFLATFWAGRH